jgi:hypothetical protein
MPSTATQSSSQEGTICNNLCWISNLGVECLHCMERLDVFTSAFPNQSTFLTTTTTIRRGEGGIYNCGAGSSGQQEAVYVALCKAS